MDVLSFTDTTTTSVYVHHSETVDSTVTLYIPGPPEAAFEWWAREAKRQAALDGVQHARVERARKPDPPSIRARHGYQQLARLPCYRGVRTR